ncbi:MAG: hypothetical protein IPK99_14075 [Flavobacteriales bacterium]|nr:hypothetical protein [Flavobacteriales bacterium]
MNDAANMPSSRIKLQHKLMAQRPVRPRRCTETAAIATNRRTAITGALLQRQIMLYSSSGSGAVSQVPSETLVVSRCANTIA